MTETDIDYTIPRNESEVYCGLPREEYGNDIAKFVFTEFYITQHTAEVIRDMKLFIRTGEHFVYKHKRELANVKG